MNIFEQGKRIMRKSGNLQTMDGKLSQPRFNKKDIEAGHSYVCLDEKGDIIGTFTFIPGKDPAHIYEGQWLDDERPYATIHRLASTEDSHGVAAACLGGATPKYRTCGQTPTATTSSCSISCKNTVSLLRHHLPTGTATNGWRTRRLAMNCGKRQVNKH